jgi:hypothetical protein
VANLSVRKQITSEEVIGNRAVKSTGVEAHQEALPLTRRSQDNLVHFMPKPLALHFSSSPEEKPVKENTRRIDERESQWLQSPTEVVVCCFELQF